MRFLLLINILFVLAGSIRDDGPLPEVKGNTYEVTNAMRGLVCKATTVLYHSCSKRA